MVLILCLYCGFTVSFGIVRSDRSPTTCTTQHRSIDRAHDLNSRLQAFLFWAVLLLLIDSGQAVGYVPMSSSGCWCDAGTLRRRNPGESGTPAPMLVPSTEEVDVAALVSQDFFDGIVNHVDGDYPGKRFYTRAAFMEALASFPGFGRDVTPDDSRREVAAFFAHVTHETGHFRFIEEICNDGRAYRDETRTEYPCAPGKRYYGRGPMQLTWNYNYGAAGKCIGYDLLGSPETVAEDPVVSFKTALWYWMERVRPATEAGMAFGATIRAINGGECGGRNPKAVERRVRFYKEYCERFGVSPGDNLTC